jgi:hypothetical protein
MSSGYRRMVEVTRAAQDSPGADQGRGTDKADLFLRRSAAGGDTWNDCGQVSTARVSDQWMPVMCVRSDGNRLFVAWYDRRDDPNNSLIHVAGRDVPGCPGRWDWRLWRVALVLRDRE